LNYKVYKISDSVTLAYIKTDKFKKARLTVTCSTVADKENSPKTSMLMPVSFLGTEKYPDFRSVCCRAEELYAADLSEINTLCGCYHIMGLCASMLNEEYVSAEDRASGFSVLDGVFEILADILKNPLFRESDTETEKANRINRIKSRQNDAFGYAKYRFLSEMQGDAPGGFPLGGEVYQVETYNSTVLKEHHKKVISCAPFEFFYCGTADADKIIGLIKKYFGDIGGSREAVDYKPRLVAGEPKYIEESGEYRQGNLLVGFRTATLLSDKDYYATELMNQIYGESPSSKLFMNVREKRSLCYFCASSYDEQKGTLAVGCGIDNGAYSEALSEILLQLEEIKNGNITDDEITAAKEALESDCREAEDHPIDYENFGRVERLFGGPADIETYRRGIVAVTRDDISAAATKLTLDTVYFLRGDLCGEDGDILE